MTFWAILILLVLVASLVAYVGDLVARRVGKRHWRLLGLRPRATATLVAVGTGALIALGAFGTFFLLVREARETILQAEAIRQERDRLRAEVGRLENRAASIFSQYEQLKAERDEFERSIDLLARQLAQQVELQRQTRQGLEEALVERERLRQELERLKEEGRSLRAALAALQQTRLRLVQEKERLEAEKRRLLSDRAALEAQVREAEHRLRQVEAAQRGSLARLEELQQRSRVLETRLRELEAEKRNLEGDVAVLGGGLSPPASDEATLRLVESLQQENRELKNRLLEARRELQQLKERNRLFAASLDRSLRMVLLAEEPVQPGNEQIALAEVTRRAENRIRLLGLRGMELVETPHLGNQGPGLLLARVQGIGGEGRVRVVLEYRPRQQAFPEGEVLASALLALPASAGELGRKLNALSQAVEARLSEAGWVPEKLAQGGIPLEEFAALAAQLSGRRGGARIGVVALSNLYPTEPPRLGLRILP
ncbi:DUF3084 domain-containing protein [Meiothermus sp. QL-1]|uniref:DUF3084 domain-containing protein n=1 Tax=Meiothermus sp. QL-1 TaxID=2058095 RepID=UPI000E0CAC1E|nr:DUF3084 domain-containing protein [Meiothermus sp. QL-1]RDI95077.1 DUF3084 domain-containing protein [Meiothermus sp. QL-1]